MSWSQTARKQTLHSQPSNERKFRERVTFVKFPLSLSTIEDRRWTVINDVQQGVWPTELFQLFVSFSGNPYCLWYININDLHQKCKIQSKSYTAWKQAPLSSALPTKLGGIVLQLIDLLPHRARDSCLILSAGVVHVEFACCSGLLPCVEGAQNVQQCCLPGVIRASHGHCIHPSHEPQYCSRSAPRIVFNLTHSSCQGLQIVDGVNLF